MKVTGWCDPGIGIANNWLMEAIGIFDRKPIARRKKPRVLWLAGRGNVYVYSYG